MPNATMECGQEKTGPIGLGGYSFRATHTSGQQSGDSPWQPQRAIQHSDQSEIQDLLWVVTGWTL